LGGWYLGARLTETDPHYATGCNLDGTSGGISSGDAAGGLMDVKLGDVAFNGSWKTILQ
jgi:hypothetical protein